MAGRRGFTLIELLMTMGLLVLIIGLSTIPFILATRTVKIGGTKIQARALLRVPLNVIVRDLMGGTDVGVYAPDAMLASSNQIYFKREYPEDPKVRLISFGIYANGDLFKKTWRLDSSSYVYVPELSDVIGHGVTYLFFQPKYIDPTDPGAMKDYDLPVPDPTSITTTPPKICTYLPGRSSIFIHMIAFDPGSFAGLPGEKNAPQEFATCVTLRN